ncbi:MAG TPA: GtrA family protein, partial [Clostridia bacterium]
HTPEDICRIVRAMQENPETLVLGVRNFKGKVPLKNRLGNGITRLLFAAINGKVVRDTQTGLRGLPPVYLPLFLSLAGERYEYEMNMLLAIRQNGIALCQVPIDTIYIEGNRSSHFNVWLDSFRIYRLILKYLLSSASSAAIDYLVFALLNATLPGQLIYSVVVARIASSLVNFSVNRKLVFKHHGNSKRCFVRYYLLVFAVMLCSYALIKLFHEMLGLNIFAAKVISDILLFVVSFFIQREFVYKEASDTQPESDPEGW